MALALDYCKRYCNGLKLDEEGISQHLSSIRS
jgi:hypothetical protein